MSLFISSKFVRNFYEKLKQKRRWHLYRNMRRLEEEYKMEFKNHKVGYLILMRIVENCTPKGLKKYDTMRGAEPYKIIWGAKNRKNLEVRFINKGFRAKIFSCAKHARALLSRSWK